MKMLRNTAAMLAISACLASPAQANTELSLEFSEPTGTVGNTDAIEIWAILSVSGDEPFTFDTTVEDPVFGLSPSLLPTTGHNYDMGLYDVAFDSYSDASPFVSRNCSGSFTNACAGGEYSIEANVGANSWFAVGSSFELAPGEQQSFLMYTLTPTNGSATPGTYALYNIGLGLSIRGLDAEGNVLEAEVSVDTCPFGSPDCSFARTVVASVPEPESWAMLLAGLGLIGWTARSRHRV